MPATSVRECSVRGTVVEALRSDPAVLGSTAKVVDIGPEADNKIAVTVSLQVVVFGPYSDHGERDSEIRRAVGEFLAASDRASGP